MKITEFWKTLPTRRCARCDTTENLAPGRPVLCMECWKVIHALNNWIVR